MTAAVERTAAPPDVSRRLAGFAAGARLADMPADVRRQAPLALLNILGCMLGGSQAPSVLTTLATARRLSGPPQAGVVGHAVRLDVLNAALVNAIASAVLVYDDTHLETVLHPSGPVAAALLALAEHMPMTGRALGEALLIGIEVSCRAAMMLASHPAECHTGFSMTGLVGGIGAAAAAGRILGLDEDQMEAALGTAASQGAGFRQTHSSMAGYFTAAQGARSGLLAALLAQDGFTCAPRSLEGPRGFGHIYAARPNFDAAISGLGARYELMSNTYKPYPCGVVIHPIIDACLEIAAMATSADAPISRVDIDANALAVELTGQRNPANELEAQVSLTHWAAAALLRGRAGLAESRLDVIRDPAVVALGERIHVRVQPGIARDAVAVRVHDADGRVRESTIRHCRGSLERPMTDAEVAAKFTELSATIPGGDKARALLQCCLDLDQVADVGADLAPFLHPATQISV